jgi:Fe2+ transport system protein FeoA
MEAKKYATLAAVVDETLAGRPDNARALLDQLVERHLNAQAGSGDLQYYIFASALGRRLESGRTTEINLYLRQFETTQISLFNLLARHLPTVQMAGPLANEVLAGYVGGNDEVTLLDVGIGSGRQEVALLYQLGTQRRLPRKLNVIAIEPDAGSLLEAGESLAEAALMLGVDLEFHPVHKVVEELDDADWRFFGSFGAPLVALSAFAVHHVRSTGRGSARDAFFRRLRALAPDAVVLCEPSSDHDSPSLRERFEAAWHHFGLTFRLIDELEIGDAEKSAMKMFFAREIEDILGNAEETRCERHEPVDAWVRRLREAGFVPCTDFGLVGRSSAGPVRVAVRNGYLGLDYGDETLVAIVCATSGVVAPAGRISPRLLEAVA